MRWMQEEAWVEGMRLVTLNGREYLLSVKCYGENVTSVLPPFFFTYTFLLKVVCSLPVPLALEIPLLPQGNILLLDNGKRVTFPA